MTTDEAVIAAVEERPPRPVLRILVFLLVVGSPFAVWYFGFSRSGSSEFAVSNVRSWMLPPAGAKITAPRAVHVGYDNQIYVLDDAGRVVVFGDGGRVLRQWWMPEYEVGRPEGICLLQDGRIGVADTHYNRVVFFNRVGEVVSYLGELGNQPGQFAYPVAITQDDHGFVYVAEYGDHQRVQKFTPEGEFVLQFGQQGTGGGEFQRPSGVVWHDGHVYVVDAFNNRVHLFTDSGEFLRILAEPDKSAELQYPYDITKASDGTVYVVEYKAGRVTHLAADGKLLGRFGRSGRNSGEFITPWGISFRPASGGGAGSIFIADTGNRRVVELEL